MKKDMPDLIQRGLDVPGFSHGHKTGEYIDVPRIFGGRPQVKRSAKPHSAQELLGGRNISRARRLSLLNTEISKDDYHKHKRQRNRKAHKPITFNTVACCVRRFLEFQGLKATQLKLVEPIETIQSKPKVIYEVTDGLMPYVTYTSAREAQLLVYSCARYGVALYFNQIKI